MSSWTGIGVMSGSSLDGLDLCCTEFTGDYVTDIWSHRILKAVTIPYQQDWNERLKIADQMSGKDLIKLHVDYGRFVAQHAKVFIEENALNPKFVASHGHTVFHQPDSGYTFQIGDGETMAAFLGIPLVTNFRNKDVALGGQGAPLVPVGETYLFSQYDMCMNMGGIVNISVHDRGFDISPCNMLLNFLAEKYNAELEFDDNGAIARGGNVIESVLTKLNSLPFYQMEPPKSLGKEWFEDNILPLIVTHEHSVRDLLRTSVEHVTDQIIQSISRQYPSPAEQNEEKSLLITGGGALNNFLIERLHDKLKAVDFNIIITESDEETVRFKEAMIFAFLGLRTLLGLPNTSCSVTGARCDTVSGSIHLPPENCPLSGNTCQDYRFHFRSAAMVGYVPPLAKRSTSVSSCTSNTG